MVSNGASAERSDQTSLGCPPSGASTAILGDVESMAQSYIPKPTPAPCELWEVLHKGPELLLDSGRAGTMFWPSSVSPCLAQ